jgi:hypothetical protein
VTVNNVTYQQNTFIGNGASNQGNNGIKGANSSDHGLFGQTTANNYTIVGNTFKSYRMALQLGAVANARVTGNTFLSNDVAVMINDGNLYIPKTVSVPDRGAYIEGNTFKDNGVASMSKSGDAGSILFRGHGGDVGVTVTGNQFVAPNAAPPVIKFNAPSTWDGISITNNSYTGTKSQFLVQANGAQLGPTVTAANN